MGDLDKGGLGEREDLGVLREFVGEREDWGNIKEFIWEGENCGFVFNLFSGVGGWLD